jgi:hypothetical protein
MGIGVGLWMRDLGEKVQGGDDYILGLIPRRCDYRDSCRIASGTLSRLHRKSYAPTHWNGERVLCNDPGSEWLSRVQTASRNLLPGTKLYSCSPYCASMTFIPKVLAQEWLRCGC